MVVMGFVVRLLYPLSRKSTYNLGHIIQLAVRNVINRITFVSTKEPGFCRNSESGMQCTRPSVHYSDLRRYKYKNLYLCTLNVVHIYVPLHGSLYRSGHVKIGSSLGRNF